MTVKRVSPQEADRLLREAGYVYVDVRSIPEFDAGHPTGAFSTGDLPKVDVVIAWTSDEDRGLARLEEVGVGLNSTANPRVLRC